MRSPEQAALDYQVRAPRWIEWQAVAAGKAVGPSEMLRQLLLICSSLTQEELGVLPAPTADELSTAILALMEREATALGLVREEGPDGQAVLTGKESRFLLVPWTFGERHQALERSLRLTEGNVELDVAAFERAMLLTCVRVDEGGTIRRLRPEEMAEWPVALGETAIRLVDELNCLSPEADRILAESARLGIRHPSLDLAYLCLTFGWTPAQVELLGALQVDRLLSGLRAIRGEQVAQHVSDRDDAGEVTRIVVTND